MRGGWSKTFAVVGAVGLLAVSACGNSNDNKSVHVWSHIYCVYIHLYLSSTSPSSPKSNYSILGSIED